MPDHFGRRSFLTTLGSSTAILLAGCASNSTSSDTTSTDGSGTVQSQATQSETLSDSLEATTTEPPTTTETAGGQEWNYSNWLPASSTLGTDGLYRFTRVDGGTVAANKQYITSDTYDFYKKALELQVQPTGIAMSAMSMLLFQDIRVVTGEFTADIVAERLINSSYTKQQDYQGYAIYKNTKSGHSVGVAGNTMVWNRNTEATDRAGTVEVAIDAKTGAVPRLASQRSAVADLFGAFGDGVVISGQEPEGEWIIQGAAVTLNGDSTVIKDARVYESEEDIDVDAFEQDLKQVQQRDGVQSVSISTDGRVAIATITGDTATYGSTVLGRLIA